MHGCSQACKLFQVYGASFKHVAPSFSVERYAHCLPSFCPGNIHSLVVLIMLLLWENNQSKYIEKNAGWIDRAVVLSQSTILVSLWNTIWRNYMKIFLFPVLAALPAVRIVLTAKTKIPTTPVNTSTRTLTWAAAEEERKLSTKVVGQKKRFVSWRKLGFLFFFTTASWLRRFEPGVQLARLRWFAGWEVEAPGGEWRRWRRLEANCDLLCWPFRRSMSAPLAESAQSWAHKGTLDQRGLLFVVSDCFSLN